MNYCEHHILLSQYMDGQLDAQTADKLEQHLPLCPQCRRELEQMTALRQLCLNLPEEDLPAGLHGRIMAGARSTGAGKGLGWVRRAVIPLAAAVLIFLLGRGIPDSLNHKSGTAQDSGGAENMLMEVPEESDFGVAGDIAAEDAKSTDSVKAPMATEEAKPENQAAEDSADEAGNAGDIRAAGEKSGGVGLAAGEVTTGSAEAEARFSGFERPSYLKYGIIIALIVGLGFTIIRLMSRKK